VGTLTIIASACDLGYIESYEAACEELKKTNFRFTKKVQNKVEENILSDKPNNKIDASKKTDRGFSR
jgi:predicted nucleic acid-binding protein